MIFEWDERKNALNIEQHDIGFFDAWKVFQEPMLKRVDDRKDYGEVRLVGLGRLEDVVVTIVYTMRGEIIRIISLRKANRNERKIYKTKFGEQNELEEIA